MQRLAATMAMAIAFLNVATSSRADGIMLPDIETWKKMRDEGLVMEPEQRAVIVYSKGNEDLIISPRYEGQADRFAWVIPVPSRPEVELADRALFDELDEALYYGQVPKSPSLPKTNVEVIERRVIGDYDVGVLDANDAHALMNWLSDNAYYLPDLALGPIEYYVGKRWTFVACKIHDPVRSAKGLRTGTLAPLKMSFASKRPMYPLRLSAANPEPFDVDIYLLVPDPNPALDYRVVIDLPVLRGDRFLPLPSVAYPELNAVEAAQEKPFPALARLAPRGLHVFHVAYQTDSTIRPKQCVRDLYWNLVTGPPRAIERIDGSADVAPIPPVVRPLSTLPARAKPPH